jgi:hypothetical protein
MLVALSGRARRALGRHLREVGFAAIKACRRTVSGNLRAGGGGVNRALSERLRADRLDLRALRRGANLRANRRGDRALGLHRRAERGLLGEVGRVAFIGGARALGDHLRAIGLNTRALGGGVCGLRALGHVSEQDRADGKNLWAPSLLLRALSLFHDIRTGRWHHRASGGFCRAKCRMHCRRTQGRKRRALGLLAGALRGHLGAGRRASRAGCELGDAESDFHRTLGDELRTGGLFGGALRLTGWTDGSHGGRAEGGLTRALG